MNGGGGDVVAQQPNQGSGESQGSEHDEDGQGTRGGGLGGDHGGWQGKELDQADDVALEAGAGRRRGEAWKGVVDEGAADQAWVRGARVIGGMCALGCSQHDGEKCNWQSCVAQDSKDVTFRSKVKHA